MRIGVCASVHHVGQAERAGFDYIECPLTELAAMEKAEFLAVQGRLGDSAVSVEACNLFFPGLRITGPEVDGRALAEYIGRAMERAAMVGAEFVVLGNGALRAVPDGWPVEDARSQLIFVLECIGRYGETFGLTVLLEPLNRKETNLVNSVAEGLEMVRAVAHPRVKLLADYYHVRMESEDVASIAQAGEWIKHLHFANGIARRFPRSVDEDEYRPFVRACRATGSERISLEARTEDFDTDAPKAVVVMRELFS